MSAILPTPHPGIFPQTTAPSGSAAAHSPDHSETLGSFGDLLHQEESGHAPAKNSKAQPPSLIIPATSPIIPAPSPTVPATSRTVPGTSPVVSAPSVALNATEQSPVVPTAIPIPPVLSQIAASTETVSALSPLDEKLAPLTDVEKPAPAVLPAKNPAQSQPLPAGSSLSAMLVQATVQASSVVNGLRTIPSETASSHKGRAVSSSEVGPDKKSTPALLSDAVLSAWMAQAPVPATGLPQAPAAKAIPGAAIQAILALGNEIPLSSVAGGLTGSPAKEKKSMPAKAEGSFIQSGTATSPVSTNPLSVANTTLSTGSQPTPFQSIASGVNTKNSPAQAVAPVTSPVTGTANVKKETVMNADLNSPGVFLSANGANTPSGRGTGETHLILGSNHDFESALKQVFRAAQLNQANGSGSPTRVAIEIQTPPGAVVNVYVSKQNDQWRAQLSTSDPRALAWVQDKMNSLRQSGDFGVEVRWLPPQIETGTGGDSNLSWDRGGQGQPNQQQPDERSQAERQKRAGLQPRATTDRKSQFADAIQALGRAG